MKNRSEFESILGRNCMEGKNIVSVIVIQKWNRMLELAQMLTDGWTGEWKQRKLDRCLLKQVQKKYELTIYRI